MKQFLLSLLACVACGWASVPAQADLLIVFSDGSTTATNFNVAVNSTNTFTISIMETGSNNELSSDGLVGFGLTANYSALSGTKGEVTANAVDSAFDFPTDEDFTSTQLDLAGIDLDSANDGPPVGTTIALGQFDFNVTAAGVTQFVFDDYSVLSDFATPSGVDLDPIIFANGRTFSMTISAVPEPGSLVSFGMVSLGVLARRRRRTRV